jgi:5-enolpyruvylshikimate-3-phosphate synthase
MLILAKTLVPRGMLIIENMVLESWNTATLDQIRKMGCRPAIQETDETAFGTVGMVQLQKFTPGPRKLDCTPRYLYAEQLGTLVALACFTRGQSVFRSLEDLRLDEPDSIEQMLYCVRTLGGRHGTMPDGMVIDGARDYDGFDLTEPLPATMSGPCVIAGLRCAGKSTIEDKSLLERLPQLPGILEEICQYRAEAK